MLCHVRDLRLPLYLLLTKLNVLVGQFMIKDTWTPYYNITKTHQVCYLDLEEDTDINISTPF